MNPEEVSPRSNGPFRVGEWLVRPELNRVSINGRTIQIEPRVMEVFVHLAECAGRVVSRKELHDAVWGETVVSDQTLTRAIWELRNVLGDDSDAPTIIETIRKGGYRLIAPVTRAEDPDAPELSQGAANGNAASRERRARALLGVPGIVAVFVVVAIVATWSVLTLRERPAGPSVLEARPLTSLPHRELRPAISPDGTRVVFSWRGDGDNYDLYVKQVNAESRLRLTETPENEVYATWSPDGATVAFVRTSDHNAIYTVPSIGGEARKLGSAGYGVEGIDWSPDGAWIAYASYDGPRTPSGIKLLSPETLETRELTAPPPRFARYSWPRFSPNGQSVAFLRSSNLVQKDIWVVPVDGGEPRRLTHMLCPMAGIDWTADGKHLVLSASQGQDHFLWLVSADKGSPTMLSTQFVPATYPSVSGRTNSLVFESQSVDRGIWRVAIGDDSRGNAEPAPFITSTRMDCCAEYSPDGSRIAFLSARSGHKEVWICNNNGGDLRRLTSMKSLSMHQPRWSPDGQHIALSAFLGDHARAFVIDTRVGTVRCLSTAPRHEIVDSWSRDGDWIYMHCSSDSGWRGEKTRVDGTATTALGIEGPMIFESVENELFFFKFGERGIWKSGPQGGEAQYVVSPEVAAAWTDITIVDEGVFHVHRSPQGEIVRFFDFSTGGIDTLASLEGLANANLVVSPDRRTALFDRTERNESDVILVPEL